MLDPWFVVVVQNDPKKISPSWIISMTPCPLEVLPSSFEDPLGEAAVGDILALLQLCEMCQRKNIVIE